MSKRAIKPRYRCNIHGPFREYQDYLGRLKNWCLLWTTLSMIPLTILLHVMQINLTLVHLFMGVTINSAVIPVTLSMFWERLTGPAMMAGSIGGTVLALAAWIGVSASTEDISANIMSETSSLTGNLVSLLSGGIIAVTMSLLTGHRSSPEESEEIWESTRDIDNPLSPWTELYAKDLNLTGAHRLDNRPSLEDVQQAFKGAKYVAFIGSITLSVILVLIWPSIMVATHIMSYDAFFQWVTLSKVWAFLATIFIVIAPLINEIWDIYKAFKHNQKVQNSETLANGDQNVVIQTVEEPPATNVTTADNIQLMNLRKNPDWDVEDLDNGFSSVIQRYPRRLEPIPKDRLDSTSSCNSSQFQTVFPS